MTSPNGAISAPQPKPQRKFWITDAALSNVRERVNLPSLPTETEELSNHIDHLVTQALDDGTVEDIRDGNEDARLVRIIDGSDPIYALVKKSNNPNTAPYAVVTIMTQTHVDKRRSTSWKTSFSVSGISTPVNRRKLMSVVPVVPAIPSPPPAQTQANVKVEVVRPQPKLQKGTFLILYRVPNVPTPQLVWADPADVNSQLNTVNGIQGVSGIEVYRKVELGLHIVE